MRQFLVAAAFAVVLAVSDSSVKAEEGESTYSPNVYISAAGGAVFLGAESVDYRPAINVIQNFDFKTGFAAQGAVGITLPRNFRTELEVTYRENDLKNTYTQVGFAGDVAGDVTAVTAMANVLFDFQPFEQFKLFAGGGIGVASIHLDIVRPSIGGFQLVAGSTNRFAYQAIAGASFEVFDGVSIFGKYTYLGTADDSLTFRNQSAASLINGSFDYHNQAVFGGVTVELGNM